MAATTMPEITVLQMPQRPIDRLPVRRLSNEPKEAMNCKSCRKRKIKCNRLRPSCEACKVFTVECVYDAVPKKRGPKTDVLEALLKRVNGLEKRLKDDPKKASPEDSKTDSLPIARATKSADLERSDKRKHIPNEHVVRPKPEPQTQSLAKPHVPPFSNSIQHFRSGEPSVHKDALLDLYFQRLHGKPYYILDETLTRQLFATGRLPANILDSIHAMSARYGYHHLGGFENAVKLSDERCNRARMSLNSDEPTIENLQTSLLLSNAFFQAGKGKKSFMLLSNAISMALALGLHRELPSSFRVPLAEREGRRRLFWTCYLMDRFTASGSKRPSLIADEAVQLRLPAWPAEGSAEPQEGHYFANGSSHPMASGNTTGGRLGHSTYASLIEITRILGITNRYLAAGGVKGDSHFPWHSQSTLSRIRQDLEVWAASNQEHFVAVESLFAQSESLTVALARLVYHLVHCLIYRPFLPVDLIELAGTEQHQPWQLEATNLCFLHANAIANLVEVGTACSAMDWPAFVGYCLCTAGTVHVHGAHYVGRDGDFFARSAEFLAGEMTQLNAIRLYHAGVQHQKEILQMVYGCHSQLVKSLASNPMRFSPVFQMEDFFDRYPGQYIDGAHVILRDVVAEESHQSLPAFHSMHQHQRQQHEHEHHQPQQPDRSCSLSAAEISAFMPGTSLPQLSDALAMPSKKRRRTNDDAQPGMAAISGVINNTNHVMQHTHSLPDRQSENNGTQPSLATPSEYSEIQAPHAPGAGEQTPSQNPFSPNFSFSPWPTSYLNSPAELRQTLAPPTMQHSLYNGQMDSAFTFGYGDKSTPSGMSNTGSLPSESDKDPFLSLLEQLAENENSQQGGPSDLDFLLRVQTS